MGVNMSFKIHLLDAHLDSFLENCGAYSDEYGERFHQEMSTMETRIKGKGVTRLLAHYCWSICWDTNPYLYKRANKKPKLF